MFGLLLYAVLTGRNTVQEPEEVLVAVNDSVLTREDADGEVELRIASDRDHLDQERLAELEEITREKVSREFVNRKILLEEADRRGIKSDPAVVEERWQSVQSGAAPRLLSTDILRIHLIGQDRTRSDVEEGVRIDALLTAVMTADVDVTDADIEQYKKENSETLKNPDRVNAQQFFIPVPRDADAEIKAAKRELADSVHARLLAGAEFSQIVEESPDSGIRYTDASHSITRGEFSLKSLEDLLFTHEINKVGPVVESEFGFHIVKVVSREKGRMPDDGVLRGAVEQQKRSARLHQFMKGLEE
ncbi:MAG: peptidylprolyl isomerase, partial [Verrucomicrobiota bacterium]